nr:recombinase family protein [Mesorhizobium camelthorni]
MVAEVCLGKVGAVAAREVSRFARNSRDWQQLIEMCRVVDTVLVDQETVYAPRQGNDRLLLGLKGSLKSTSSIFCASVRSQGAPWRTRCCSPCGLREGRGPDREGSRSPCAGSDHYGL